MFEVFLRVAFLSISSGVLVQTNGVARVFQPLMKARILVVRSLTEVNTPRPSAWRWMTPNHTSTRLSHDADVGVKCTAMRGLSASQALTSEVLWVA